MTPKSASATARPPRGPPEYACTRAENDGRESVRAIGRPVKRTPMSGTPVAAMASMRARCVLGRAMSAVSQPSPSVTLPLNHPPPATADRGNDHIGVRSRSDCRTDIVRFHIEHAAAGHNRDLGVGYQLPNRVGEADGTVVLTNVLLGCDREYCAHFGSGGCHDLRRYHIAERVEASHCAIPTAHHPREHL